MKNSDSEQEYKERKRKKDKKEKNEKIEKKEKKEKKDRKRKARSRSRSDSKKEKRLGTKWGDKIQINEPEQLHNSGVDLFETGAIKIGLDGSCLNIDEMAAPE